MIWHKVWDKLVARFSVVAIDLRGYGRSSKPAGDERHAVYGKQAMSQDCVNVMTKMGHSRFFVCAHDRGARVAHKLLVDHPASVIKAILLDICPTVAMFGATNFDFASAYYHWFFLIQPSPFPEDMILANPEAFMKRSLGRHPTGESEVFTEETYASYLSVMRDPAAVHAMCEDYRAAASIDIEQHKQDDEQGRKIKAPLLVLWGKKGVVEKLFDAVAEWKKASDSSVEGESLDSGHYIPEEVPEVLLDHILQFFGPMDEI